MAKSQTRCCTPGCSVNSTMKCAKSTCAWQPGGLEADLEGRDHGRSDRAEEVIELSDATGVAALAHFAKQPYAAEFGPGGHALAQVGLVGTDQRWPRYPQRVLRHHQ